MSNGKLKQAILELRRAARLNREPPQPVATMIGAAPRPKATIVAMPRPTWPVLPASVSMA